MPASSESLTTGTWSNGDRPWALGWRHRREPAEQAHRPSPIAHCLSEMQIARVVGTLVATQKHRKFEGAKLLIVQPLNLDDSPRGNALLAVDGVGAGVHEKVLIVLEGRAAGEALGKRAAPVDAAIIGIVDHVDVDGNL